MGVSFEELWRQLEERLSYGKLDLRRLELLGEMKQMEMDAERKELIGEASGDERLASVSEDADDEPDYEDKAQEYA